MPAQVKIDAVGTLRDTFGKAQSVILVDFRGINSEEMTELRVSCRQAGIELKVIKNRLAKRALGDLGLPTLEAELIGPTMMAIGLKDPVTPAKVLVEFAKKHEKMQIKGGLIGRDHANAAAVKRLSTLPSREELLARMAGSLASPATKIAIAINEVIGGLARTIRAVAEQKQAA